MPLRHQLTVYSPIPGQAAFATFIGSLRLGADPRIELAGLLRREYSADDVQLCGSGTQALQVAIECARKETGDQDGIVALPAFSCFDVASAAVGAGARVALYDLDPLTLSPDLDSLRRVVVRGARVVVVAPLYGLPVDWESIAELASEHDATLIEDAAQGHGATYRGQPLGALGHISTLSFGRGKGWTGGSGGAVLYRGSNPPASVLPQPSSIESVKTTIGLGAQWGLGRPAVYGLPRAMPGLELGETVYHEPRAPTGMSRAAAAAALATRDESYREVERRRAMAEWLKERVADQPALCSIHNVVGGESLPGYLRFPLLAREGIEGFGDSASRLGITPGYPNELSALPQLAPRVVADDLRRPGAAQLVEQLVTLPVHSLVSGQDRSRLADRIRAYRSSISGSRR